MPCSPSGEGRPSRDPRCGGRRTQSIAGDPFAGLETGAPAKPFSGSGPPLRPPRATCVSRGPATGVWLQFRGSRAGRVARGGLQGPGCSPSPVGVGGLDGTLRGGKTESGNEMIACGNVECSNPRGLILRLNPGGAPRPHPRHSATEKPRRIDPPLPKMRRPTFCTTRARTRLPPPHSRSSPALPPPPQLQGVKQSQSLVRLPAAKPARRLFHFRQPAEP